MFVRRKTIKGRTYFYLVKSVRDGDRITQQYLEYLGAQMPTKKQLDVLKKKYQKKTKVE